MYICQEQFRTYLTHILFSIDFYNLEMPYCPIDSRLVDYVQLYIAKIDFFIVISTKINEGKEKNNCAEETGKCLVDSDFFLWIISVASLVCHSFTGRGFGSSRFIQTKSPPIKGGGFVW